MLSVRHLFSDKNVKYRKFDAAAIDAALPFLAIRTSNLITSIEYKFHAISTIHFTDAFLTAIKISAPRKSMGKV